MNPERWEDFVQTIRRTVALGLVAALAACADGVGPSGFEQLDADLALVAVEMTAQDVELMGGPGALFGVPGLPGHFACGTVQRGNGSLSVERTCTYFDADGNEQDAYDVTTTASIALHLEVDGAIEHGQFSATVARVRDLTVTGLAGDETSRTWNGTGTGAVNRVRPTRAGEQTEFDLQETESIADLVIPVPRAPDAWPLGGTITKHVIVAITGGPRDGTAHERDLTITFDGTQFATVTVNGETFTVDLARRRHAGPNGRPLRGGRGPLRG